MATESPAIHDGSQMTAAADLSAKQFFIVKVAGSRTVNVTTATTDTPYGVLQNKPKSGEAADVVILGIAKVLAANAGITAGVKFTTDASGNAVAWTTSGSKCVIGTALETVAANQVFTAMILPIPNII